MTLINKTDDSISPYTYFLTFMVGGTLKFYYGVRYGNVKLGLRPSEDLMIRYRTSSKVVKALLDSGNSPTSVIIHKCFDTPSAACKYEVRLLTRLKAKRRKDWLNQCDKFDNSLPSNAGRVRSREQVEKMSETSKLAQSSDKYRASRRLAAKARWSDPEFKNRMDSKNSSYWSGPEGQEHLRTRTPATLGHSHSDKTKATMRDAALAVCADRDYCKRRAMNRPRYTCPICARASLDGSNFNNHMKASHGWSKEASTDFKFSESNIR